MTVNYVLAEPEASCDIRIAQPVTDELQDIALSLEFVTRASLARY